MTRRREDTTTLQLADDLTEILDYLSRMLGAVDDGNAAYLHDKARQLARAALQLHRHMSEYPLPDHNIEPCRFDDTKTFNPAKLKQLVTEHARHYRAGRALYPQRDPIAAARHSALESAAIDLTSGGGPKGLGIGPATEAMVKWLLARAEREGTTS